MIHCSLPQSPTSLHQRAWAVLAPYRSVTLHKILHELLATTSSALVHYMPASILLIDIMAALACSLSRTANILHDRPPAELADDYPVWRKKLSFQWRTVRNSIKRIGEGMTKAHYARNMRHANCFIQKPKRISTSRIVMRAMPVLVPMALRQ